MVGHGGAGERALGVLLARARTAAGYQLPGLIAAAAAELGGRDAMAYLVDVAQRQLVPFVDTAAGAPPRLALEPLPVDTTLAGRAFQHQQIHTQDAARAGETRVWVPLIDGSERLGVLSLVLDDDGAASIADGAFVRRLEQLSALIAEVIVSKTRYGDDIVRLRRQVRMGLASELQRSLLPPLNFECTEVVVAGALEPAYQVAGDSIDYAVDLGIARAALLDGMGHGLRSSQLAAIAIAGYRNSRRCGLNLNATVAAIDTALHEAFDGYGFTTGVFIELNTTTGTLSWVNAGHPAPLLLRDNQVVKTLDCVPRPPLGLALPTTAASPISTTCHERLEPGDRVVLYSDGVTEARSPEGDFFGDQRLADMLTRNFAARLPAAETMRRIVRALLEHQAGQLSDDATLLLVEWRAPQHIASR